MADKKYTRTSKKPDITYVYDTSGKTDKIIPKKNKPIKKPSKLAGGGISSHGLGRAFMKGGKV